MAKRLTSKLTHAARTALGTLVLSAVLVCHAAPASSTEPEGITAGALRLHPGAFLETTYDSNLFYNDGGAEGENGGEEVGAWLLRPGVTFRIETPNPGEVDWSFNASASWEQYLDDSDQVLDRSGIEVDLGTSVILWPKRLLKLTPRVAYTRVNGPADELAQRDFNQHLINPGLSLTLQPSEGKILSSTLGYDARIQLYDEIEDLNKIDHRLQLNTKWHFLPQTAVALLLEQRFTTYQEDVRQPVNADNSAAFVLENNDATPFRGQLGVKGLLLRRLDFSLFGGYGWTGYADGPDEHVFLALVELGYQFISGPKFSVGYTKNFEDSSFGNFYLFHRVFARFTARFIDRIPVAIGGSVSFHDFASVEGVSEDRSDAVYEAHASAGYDFVPGFNVSLQYALRGTDSSFETLVANSQGQTATTASYLKHLATLIVSYEY